MAASDDDHPNIRLLLELRSEARRMHRTYRLASAMRRRMSDAELRLWANLRPMRHRGLAFRRQSAVGRYILDFECRRGKLGVEVDGAQHDATDARAYDEARTRWLESQGYVVLRFWNHDVLRSTNTVVEHIVRVAAERAPALDRR